MIPKKLNHKRMRPGKIESPKHLDYVRALNCCCCGRSPCEPHHLIANYGESGPVRGWGLRAGDNFTIPMCPEHHRALHNDGNEQRYLAQFCVDGLAMAAKLWSESHA